MLIYELAGDRTYELFVLKWSESLKYVQNPLE